MFEMERKNRPRCSRNADEIFTVVLKHSLTKGKTVGSVISSFKYPAFFSALKFIRENGIVEWYKRLLMILTF